MPVPPRFFYFDLGHVLLTFDHERACRQMAEVAGTTADRVREFLFDSGLQWDYERGDVSCREVYDRFCRATGASPDYAALRRAAGAIFEPRPETLALAAELRAAGRRLGILSNTCAAHWDYVSDGRYPPLNAAFEVFALSYELRAMKPEPAIYAAAVRLAGVEPAEIFFVDDREENVAGALAAGYDAVLFTTAEALAADLAARGAR